MKKKSGESSLTRASGNVPNVVKFCFAGVVPPRGERRVPHVPPLHRGPPAPRRRRLLADVQAAPRRPLLGLPRRPDRAGRIRAAALPQELVRATRERPRRAARLLTVGSKSVQSRFVFVPGFEKMKKDFLFGPKMNT